jgi:hypothetical protein
LVEGPVVWPLRLSSRIPTALECEVTGLGRLVLLGRSGKVVVQVIAKVVNRGWEVLKDKNHMLFCPCQLCHNDSLKQINHNASVWFWTLKPSVMTRSKYLLLFYLSFLDLCEKRVIKRPRPNAPADFSFLVQGLLFKFKTSVETVQYSIEINMDT